MYVSVFVNRMTEMMMLMRCVVESVFFMEVLVADSLSGECVLY